VDRKSVRVDWCLIWMRVLAMGFGALVERQALPFINQALAGSSGTETRHLTDAPQEALVFCAPLRSVRQGLSLYITFKEA
jgi:hypothetical protein